MFEDRDAKHIVFKPGATRDHWQSNGGNIDVQIVCLNIVTDRRASKRASGFQQLLEASKQASKPAGEQASVKQAHKQTSKPAGEQEFNLQSKQSFAKKESQSERASIVSSEAAIKQMT